MSSKEECRRHLQRDCIEKPKWEWGCMYCGLDFEFEDGLNKHISRWCREKPTPNWFGKWKCMWILDNWWCLYYLFLYYLWVRMEFFIKVRSPSSTRRRPREDNMARVWEKSLNSRLLLKFTVIVSHSTVCVNLFCVTCGSKRNSL